MRLLRWTPWMLVASRGLAGAAMALLVASRRLDDRTVLVLWMLAFVSDYFDGVIARRLGVATPALRSADSCVDTAFFAVLAWATWRLHPEALRGHTTALAWMLGSLAIWYALDAWRWRAAAGFHTWSAKLFAVTLGAWVVLLYGFASDGWWPTIACVIGTASHLEGMAISLTLRDRVSDVPTFVHALRLRHAQV